MGDVGANECRCRFALHLALALAAVVTTACSGTASSQGGTASAVVYATPAHGEEAFASRKVRIPVQKLQFGVYLGWQMGRYEIIAAHPELAEPEAALRGQIKTLVENDGHQLPPVQGDALLENIMLTYRMTDVAKVAAITLGVCALRLSLSGATSNSENREGMAQAARQLLDSVDASILAVNDRKSLFDHLRSHLTTSSEVNEAVTAIESFE